MATTVRISGQAHEWLRELADEDDLSLREELDKALEAYRRQRFYERFSERFDELREDEENWEAYRAEQDSWDATSTDGLDPYPYESDEESETG